MKFFKHFCDAHRGKSLRGIRRKLGMAGVGMYWTLVEMCAEKLEKEAEATFTEDHCSFEFDLGYFLNEMGMKAKRLQNVLGTFQEHSLFETECSENVIRIKMPKLLDSLDRDIRRARTERGPVAPKIKSKIKKESNALFQDEFKSLAGKYTRTFPGTTTGPAEPRFASQIKTEQDLADLTKAIGHYRKFLDVQKWREAKTTFATFLGTEKSGYFWRDYVAEPNIAALDKTGSGGGWADRDGLR